MNQPNSGSTENANDQVAADAVAAAMAEDTGAPLVNATELQAKIDDLQNRLLRTQAEMENFRRRSYREQEDARKFESLRMVRDILPGMDGLNRAIASAEQTGDLQNLMNGIRMVANQFKDILKAHAAEPIDALGKPFDPNLHEALTQIPSADHEPMTVLQGLAPATETEANSVPVFVDFSHKMVENLFNFASSYAIRYF